MNQDKMNEYREFKKNRKAILEQEKRKKQTRKTVSKAIAWVLAVVLVAALVITVVNFTRNKINSRPDYNRTEAVIDDIAGILDTKAETTEAETTEAESSGAESEADTTAAAN